MNKLKIIELETVDSTNTYLRALAEKGEREGCIVTATEQTAGRGRRGKSFFSPADTGLYMSILIRPELSVEDSLFITPMTAVATARAIEAVTNKKCGIKWVNDIYIGEKKVSGVLCEASFDHAADKVNYVIVGIGINLAAPRGEFPEELRHIATNLGDATIKKQLLERVTEEFFTLYGTLPRTDFLGEYRRRSVLIGKRVEVLGNESFFGTAIDFDERCRLILKTDGGEIKVLSSGEVSTKLSK